MDRVVVITGGTSGIGLACADEYARAWDKVVVLARHASEKYDSYICDVSDEARVHEVMDEIGNKYGRIDILISNAGYGIAGAIELMDTDTIKKMFDVNLYGVIYCYKYALKYMCAGGKIFNISSACALFPLPYRSYYCASKSAVDMLSQCMDMECRASKIDVCSVCPGDVKTNFSKTRVKDFATNERYGDRIEKAVGMVDDRENKRMPVEKVSKTIFKLSNKKRTKPFVIVGFKYKALYFFSKLMPTRLFNRIIDKYTGFLCPLFSLSKAG